MNCEFAEKVSAMMDGELPESESAIVARHVSSCASCREMRADFLTLRAQIENYPRKSQSPATTAVSANRRWQPVFALAAAVLLLVLGVAVWQHSRTGSAISSGDEISRNQKPSVVAPVPSPTPVTIATPKPATSPNSPDNNDEPTQVPPKFRLREAITGTRHSDKKSDSATAPAINEIAEASSPLPISTVGAAAADTDNLTASHVEQSEVLLRSFRNLRTSETSTAELDHEKRRAQQLFYQNVMLRREADKTGDVEVATLLQSLEPILLDIANLPQAAATGDVAAIKDRVERQNLVALLQINSKRNENR